MTVVQESFTNASGQPSRGAVTFLPCSIRSRAGGGAITPCPITYQLDEDGQLTTGDLEPGCYIVTIVLDCKKCPENGVHKINVPELGPAELLDLITNYGPLPPEVVDYVVSLAGLSGVISEGQLQTLIQLLDLDTSYAVTVGDGTTGPYVIVHNLNSTDIDVTVRNTASGYAVEAAWRVVDTNTISVEPDVAWASNSRRIYISKVV